MKKSSVAVALLFAGLTAHARIVRLQMQPWKGTVPSGYRVYAGTAYGELDPSDRHNASIQDIELAPRNANGRVEYAATFTLYAPIQASPKSTLIYEVVNRGTSLMPRDYANGDFFLLSGWQGDLQESRRKIERLVVPVARNKDGSTVTGPAVARWWDVESGSKMLELQHSNTYRAGDVPPSPADLKSEHAQLITRSYEDEYGAIGGEKTVPADAWHWCGSPEGSAICLDNGANPDLEYELRYTAKDPLVLGIGLAAIRDVNSFFRYDTSSMNPVAGQIHHAIGLGISQSGNAIRTYLHEDMNRDENDRPVWEGAIPIIAARQVPLNVRFGVPGGTSMLYEFGTDGANWWGRTQDTLRGNAADGLLDRCTASHSCPKIIEVMGASEFYSLRASMNYVGTSAKADLPLPENVRRFYVPSTTHGGGKGGFNLEAVSAQDDEFTFAANPNPENPITRALLLALKQWVQDGRTPPASVYPTLAAGTLKPASQVMSAFPVLPGAPRPDRGFNPSLFFDAGPQFRAVDVAGIPSNVPAKIAGATPSALPAVDKDGNELGGVRTPLLQAPLGTYTGWNVVARGFRKGQFAPLTGGYLPFAKTKAERIKTHDPRLSIEERYASHAAYVAKVKAAADRLTAQRLLLADDAAAMVKQAEESAVAR